MKFLTLLVFLTLLSVYTITTSPYLQAGDSTEMAASAITLGVPHQPSYPLYIYTAHIITKLPVPYVPRSLPAMLTPRYKVDLTGAKNILIYRAGLASALFQALAGMYLFLVCIKIGLILNREENSPSNVSVSIALLCVAIYSFSDTVWLYATKPEVFALNNLFVLALLYYAIRWYAHGKTAKIKVSYFLLLGLAFSHHQTVILIFPTLALIYLLKKQELEHKSALFIAQRIILYPFDKKFNKSFPYVFCFFFAILPFIIALWTLAQRYPFINWGEISTPIGIVRALIRADYGSIGAYLTNVKNNTVAIDQIPFFAQHLVTDFSLFLLLSSLGGVIVLYKIQKSLWAILMSIFLISGPLFLMYANFSLEGDFSKATVVRFYFIPELAIVLAIYIFFIAIYQNIKRIKIVEEGINYQKIGKLLLVLTLTALTIQSVYANRPIFDNLTYQFAKTAITQTEDNAMILVTGDIPNMTMQYMEAVEGEKKNRIIFSPGQFHLKWFQKQLRARYPTLKIPEPLPGKQFTAPVQVIDANFGKQPIYIVTDFVDIDPEIAKRYVLWPKNLLLKVEKPGIDYKLEPYLAENKKLYDSLSFSELEELRNKKYQLESPLIFYYSRHFYNLGAVFNSVHKYKEAIEQFQRAIKIDPSLADAYKALGNIYYFTADYSPKDPELASQYLYKYLQTTNGSSVDQIIAVQEALKTIDQDLKKAEEEQKKQQQAQAEAEASASATQKKESQDTATQSAETTSE